MGSQGGGGGSKGVSPSNMVGRAVLQEVGEGVAQ